MANKKYIDSELLLNSKDWLSLQNYDKARAKAIINSQPACDVVEVVRCKDCKHYEIHKPSVLENCERNGSMLPMMPNDFCSCAERKDGADNER